jgi:hypothetical protein
MGILANSAVFQDEAPSLESIVQKASELCGLSISVEELPLEDCQVYPNCFYARIYFECLHRSNYVEIHSEKQEIGETGLIQSVHLRIYMGQEGTLFSTVILALEELGGVMKHPVPREARQKYQRRLTPKKVKWRNLQVGLFMVLVYLVGIALLPVLILVWCLQFLAFWIPLSKAVREAEKNSNNAS